MLKNQKGVSLIELIVTIFLIGVTSVLTTICIRSVNNKESNIDLINEYLDEKLKLLVGFNSLYKECDDGKYNLSYKIIDDEFFIYRNNLLLIEYKDNILFIKESNMYIRFNIIKKLELRCDGNYLYIQIISKLITDEIKMRWFNE